MGWREVVVVLALLVLSAVTTPVLVDARPTDPSMQDASVASVSTDPTVSPVYTFERLPDRPGEIRVHAAYDPPATVSKLRIELPDTATVTDSRGFSATSSPFDWTWDGQPSDPTLTYTVVANHTSAYGPDGVDVGAWAQFRTHAVTPYVRWWYTGHAPSFEPDFRVADGEAGYATAHRVHLGPHEVLTEESSAGTVRLVVPAAASPDSPPNATLRTLCGAMGDLRIAPQRDDLTVFVAPQPVRSGGRAFPGTIWVSADSRADTVYNTWVHEYVHERQTFEPDAETAWVVEGSAEYYAGVVTLRQGDTDYATFHRFVTEHPYDGADLTAPATWPNSQVEYRKGTHAVALIDARIQRATDGEQTFQQVLYWLNQHDGRITWTVFADVVERVAGQNLDAFLRRVATGAHDETVPEDPWLYTGSRIDDHDGDGLTNREERAAGTSPFAADTDADGRADGLEQSTGTDPTVADGASATPGTEDTALADSGSSAESPRARTDGPSGTASAATPTARPSTTAAASPSSPTPLPVGASAQAIPPLASLGLLAAGALLVRRRR